MDLISLHQYGITNVVASLGTALTVNQARLLKRYADKVIISYDADVAGQTATLRGLEILKEAGFDVRVLKIPQGKDPDEFVRSNGKDAFLKLVDKAENLISYRLEKAKEGINFKDKSSLVEYGNRVADILANLNPVEKDIYVKSISEDIGIKEQSLYDLIAMTRNTKSDDFMNKKEEYGTKLYVEPGYVKAEKSLIKLMLEDDYYEEIVSNISSDDFISKPYAKIFNLIKEAKKKELKDINLHVEAGCDDVDSSKEWVKVKEFEVLKGKDVNKLILDYIKQIKNFKLTKKAEDLKVKLRQLEKDGLIEESIKIALELKKINDVLKKGEKS